MTGWDGRGKEGRGGDPQTLVHTPEILKDTLIAVAELTWLAGAATQTFALGGKHPRVATDRLHLAIHV